MAKVVAQLVGDHETIADVGQDLAANSRNSVASCPVSRFEVLPYLPSLRRRFRRGLGLRADLTERPAPPFQLDLSSLLESSLRLIAGRPAQTRRGDLRIELGAGKTCLTGTL